ncbi:MAG: cell wall hydrolase [Eubacteriales bacterium]
MKSMSNMLRKLIFPVLCAVASLTMTGANVAQAQENAELLTSQETEPSNHESVIATESVIVPEIVEEVQIDLPSATEEDVFVSATMGTDFTKAVSPENAPFQINGAGADVTLEIIQGVTYVPLLATAELLDASATCTWHAGSNVATVTSSALELSATANALYLVANGRYLYVPETLKPLEGDVLVPLSTLTRAFDATLYWDPLTSIITVTTGSGGILSGDQFYNADDLFWLSRVVFAESGSEPLEGKMGVAIVVYNRIADDWYPSTVLGVLSQKNQFTTYQNGALANRTPNESSIIASKLVMDGGVVEEIANATHFDSISGSWASKNLDTILVIGGHTFYG